MKHRVLWIAAAAASLGAWSRQDEFAWKTDLEASMAEGRASGKPVLIVFR